MKQYLQTLTLILLFCLIVLVTLHYQEVSWQERNYTQKAFHTLDDAAILVQEDLSNITSDILYLASEPALTQTLHRDTNSEKVLLNFMHYKKLYDQLRIIDLQGAERFRINKKNGLAYKVDPDALQHKADRYYVQEALKLNQDEIYLSPLDLNMEKGAIEIPYKPTLRVASPVYDDTHTKQGIVVINVLFELLLDKLSYYVSNDVPRMYLANNQGQWFIAPKGSKAWRFMFSEHDNQVKSYSPLLWVALQKKREGTVVTDESLINFKKINPLELIQNSIDNNNTAQSQALINALGNQQEWWMIIEIPRHTIVQEAWTNISKGLPYLVFGILLLIILSIYLLRQLKLKLHYDNELKLATTYFENASDGIIVTDTQPKIIKINPTYESITGYSSEELIGQNPSIISSGWTSKETYSSMWTSVNETGKWDGELFDRRKDGSMYTQWLRLIAIKNKEGILTNYIGVTTDITEKKKSLERIEQLAFRDTLTGLPNRSLFHDRLNHAMYASSRNETIMALLFIDLDDFKIINDTAGHLSGDLFLIEISKRFDTCVRDTDTLARLGGDEFVIILEDSSANAASDISRRLLESLEEPVTIDGYDFFASASIGIALYPEDADNAQELIQYADTAMYKAKDTGKKQYCFYLTEMNIEITRRHLIERGLKYATENDQFYMMLQPQISLENQKIIGAEALIRWEDSELGPVSPVEFIPLAESSGLIIPITLWMLKNACIAIHQCNELDRDDLNIAVNISSLHIKNENFVSSIYDCVTGMGVAPERIELEITEGALIENIEDTVEKLKRLKAHGFKIAIDDFGTGYSSLSYLKKFHFDKLKIDQSFVKELPHDLEDAGITRSIIAIGKVLGMHLIAEGAESKENITFLQDNGCDMIQGYYFSKPLHVSDFLDFCDTFSFDKNL
jgi:diguanylate cyclase (GGDEF)-like protein/PAS domain S-box-containing protein